MMKYLSAIFVTVLLCSCDNGGGASKNSQSCVSQLAPVADEILFAREEGYHMGDQERFLEDNAMREGVVILESGLQYKELRAGCGAQPNSNSSVTVHYHGTYLDGQVFDSSYESNQTSSFRLGRVIPGWVEGLTMMSEGAIWLLYIPSDLAYGSDGIEGRIPPDTAMIFTVELISKDS